MSDIIFVFLCLTLLNIIFSSTSVLLQMVIFFVVPELYYIIYVPHNNKNLGYSLILRPSHWLGRLSGGGVTEKDMRGFLGEGSPRV